jgi:RNA polymerase sporulation-specific sigma factor
VKTGRARTQERILRGAPRSPGTLDEDAILRDLGPKVVAYARRLGWFLPGAEPEDLEQEALFGLVRACRTYKPERGAFEPFAFECVRRWLVWTLRRDTTQRSRVLTSAERSVRNEDGEAVSIEEFLPDRLSDPARVAEGREQLRAIVAAAPSLTELEARAVFGQMAGFGYRELSGSGGTLDTRGKERWRDLDNAMQRGRKKLRRAA